MLDLAIQRMLDAYPDIFLACHRRHLRADQSGKGVTERQASVLDHLDPARPTTLSKLAEHMGVSRSAMSIIVARLVRGGYIVQSRDDQDGRRVSLTLTAAGVQVKAEHSVLDSELLREDAGAHARCRYSGKERESTTHEDPSHYRRVHP